MWSPAPLLEFAVKGSGRVPVTPRDRLDSVNHVVAEGRSIHGGADDHLRADAPAPNIARPSRSGRAVGADDVLPGTIAIETWSAQSDRAFEA